MEEQVPRTPAEEPELPELERLARLLRVGQPARPAAANGGSPAAQGPASPPARPRAKSPAPAAGEAPARLVAGRYEFLGLLGEGPNGRVFRVRDHRVEEAGEEAVGAGAADECALKILLAARTDHPRFEERLHTWLGRRGRLAQEEERERSRSTGRAACTGCTDRLLDAGRTELGLRYLATELVHGRSLAEHLAARGALHPREAVEIVRQVLAGLERAHAAGLVHGALHAQNVHLAARVPAGDENPFGIGVRLLDLGLAGLLRPADEPASGEEGVAGDLAAARALLATLLTGGDPAARPARLSPELRAWLEDPAPGGGPATAAAWRAALARVPEALPAGPTTSRAAGPARTGNGAAPWRAAALVLGALVVLLGALRWRGAGAEVEAASEDARRGIEAPGEDAPARLGELETRLAAADAELALLRAAAASGEADPALAPTADEAPSAAEQEELRARAAGLEQELAGVAGELAAWKQRAAEHESRASRLTEAQHRARARIELLEGELAAALGRIDEVAAQARARELALRPDTAAARLFDRALLAGEDDPAGALALFEAGRRDGVLAPGPWPGEGFVALWLGARAALARAREAAGLGERSRELERAREALAGARAGRAAFALEAAGWLALETDLVDAPVRLQEIDRVLDQVDDGLAAEVGRLRPELEARWRELLAADPDLPPEEVLAVARWSEDGRLSRWIERLAQRLQELAAAGPEGRRLDLAALRGVASLDAWAELVAARPELLASHAGREVLLFAWARRFHDPARAGEALPPGPVVHQGPGGGSPLSGWRAELELQARLLGEGSAWPGRPGARALYWTRTPDGTRGWQLETVLEDPEPPPGATRSRVVEQRSYDEQGRFLGQVRRRIVQRGKRFTEEDARVVPVLELAGAAGPARPELGYWTPEEPPPLPAGLPIAPEAALGFRGELLARGWPSLVAASGTGLAWYSPDLGLVRSEDPEASTRELVWAEAR